jgi:drug/metabolite transporter (DMT)-like permease
MAAEYRRLKCEDKPCYTPRMEPVRRGSRAGGVALVLAAAVLWSTGGVGIKSVALPALALAGWRGLFALPVLAGMVLLRARETGGIPFRRSASSPAAWVGVASYTIMVTCFVVATKLTTAADAIFIQYTSPVYVALLSWPLLRERITWRDGVACAGVLVGMVLFFKEGLSASAQLGNAIAVVSSFGAAGLPLALRADQRRFGAPGPAASWQAAALSPMLVIAAGGVLGVVVCVPAMLAAGLPTPRALGFLALLGIGQIGLPYVLYGLAVPRLTAMEGALLPTLEPILNPLWVALFTGEIPGVLAVLGGACVLASVLFRAVRLTPRGPLRSA